jgi:hypothetical protein
MRTSALASVLAGLGLTSASLVLEERQTGPPPNQVQLVSVAAGGRGCPAGTIHKQISENRDVLTLIFDAYTAQAGTGISPVQRRSACQINLKMKFPVGWQ